MVTTDNENDEGSDEQQMEPTVQSARQPPQSIHHRRHVFPPQLGRQSSVYSLTLDEFQHAISGSGKNFGSMNMDEFLNSIWTAEEHAQSQPQPHPHPAPSPATAGHRPQILAGEGSSSSAIPTQLSFPKQNSIAIPSPLFRKTVEEVWSEIQKTHEQQNEVDSHVGNSYSTEKQPTFGEMTLEDFLVKAGVVREQSPPPSQLSPGPDPLTWYQSNNTSPVPASTYVSKTPTSIVGIANIPPYRNPHSGLVVATPESSSTAYAGNGKSGGGVGGYPAVSSYNMGGLGIESPVPVPVPISPVSSDGMAGNQFVGGSNGGIRGGRKRNIGGPVEKVVERRQRRMIKNRESAARSRARKQAYTVELEAELNQLKEENSQLKHALVGLNNMDELQRKRKQQYFEEKKAKASQNKVLNVVERLRLMQRSVSGPV